MSELRCEKYELYYSCIFNMFRLERGSFGKFDVAVENGNTFNTNNDILILSRQQVEEVLDFLKKVEKEKPKKASISFGESFSVRWYREHERWTDYNIKMNADANNACGYLEAQTSDLPDIIDSIQSMLNDQVEEAMDDSTKIEWIP